MKDPNNILAHLLAAEEHPPLKEAPEFQKAQAALDADPALQSAFEEAKQFHEQHPVLIRTDKMPADVRRRIERALEKSSPLSATQLTMELSPWTVHTQFAWAALLVLLLAGMAVLSSIVLDQQRAQDQFIAYTNQPPQDAFRSYIGQTVENLPVLDMRTKDTTKMVSWLHEHGSATASAPEVLMNEKGIGCANLTGPHGNVSLLCFRVDGDIVHLFITENESIDVTEVQPAVKMKLQQREAMQWNDEAHTYLLITHDERQALPEVFL